MAAPLRILLAAGLAAGLSLALLAPVAAEPAVSAAWPDRGRWLLEELHCTACHTAPEGVAAALQPREAPDLSQAGARLHPAWMRKFLAGPHALRPGTPMPDLLAGSPPERRATTIEALVQYLAGRGGTFPGEAAEVTPSAVERGRRLYHTVGCIACHPARDPAEEFNPELAVYRQAFRVPGGEDEEDEEAEGEPAPAWTPPEPIPLDDLPGKTHLEALTAFLLDPRSVRPSGRMPAFPLSESEARDLAAWLLADERALAAAGEALRPGVAWELFEDRFEGPVAEFEGREPVSRGIARGIGLEGVEHPPDGFALRFRATLQVPESGRWVFWTRSDDGSRLFLDGELVVRNDGVHPPQEARGEVELRSGPHDLEVHFFEATGGEELEVRWQAPGSPEAVPIPPEALLRPSEILLQPAGGMPAPDPRLQQMGRMVFSMLGCVRCHEPEAEAPAGMPARPFPALTELRDLEGGCLAPEPVRGVPFYGLQPGDRELLASALRDLEALARPRPPAEALMAGLERLRCLACHERDALGGPEAPARDYFVIEGYGELGDEGRIPPRLTGVGAKLQPQALRAILRSQGRVRPAMATRMPDFGAQHAERLAELFLEVDAAGLVEKEPPFSPELAEAGRFLAGENGVACINCHGVNGLPSLGIPAVDLGTVAGRLRPSWFRRLLWDPASLNMNTRMPAFWWEGARHFPEILDGDPQRQIGAIWAWLSLGESMPPPDGLVVDRDAYELVPQERPLYFGAFLKDVGPRGLCIGFPERVHAAFERGQARLAWVWRGAFADAEGTWRGRAGQLLEPAGSDWRVLPPGPVAARLPSADAPWPEAGAEFLGWELDAEGLPTFRSRQPGGLILEESLRPVLAPGGSRLLRSFRARLEDGAAEGGWSLRLATGRSAAAAAGGWWEVDGGRLRFRLEGEVPPEAALRVRRLGETAELLLGLPAGGARVSVLLDW